MFDRNGLEYHTDKRITKHVIGVMCYVIAVIVAMYHTLCMGQMPITSSTILIKTYLEHTLTTNMI